MPHRGAGAARLAHNQEVGGASPPGATNSVRRHAPGVHGSSVASAAAALAIRRISPLADGDAREAAAQRKAHAERMRKRHADPEFAKANAERMRKLHADPEFAAKAAAAVSAAQKKRWAAWRAKKAAG